MIEDRVLGLKARENYEHPAATVLLSTHKDLEKLVLTRAVSLFLHVHPRMHSTQKTLCPLTVRPLTRRMPRALQSTMASRQVCIRRLLRSNFDDVCRERHTYSLFGFISIMDLLKIEWVI